MGLRSAVRAWLAADQSVTVPASEEPSQGPVAVTDGLNDNTGFSVTTILGRGGSKVAVSERTALTIPAFLRAMEILSGVFALTPLIYYRQLPDGGKERAKTSPLYDIFRSKPNATQSDFLFKEVMLLDLMLARGFYAFTHRNELFQTTALSRLDPHSATVNRSWDKKDGDELFFDVTLPNGARERLTRADIWHVPGFSRDGIVGLDRIQFVRDALASAVATSEFAARFWENNAQPSTVLTAKGKVAPEDKSKIRADWKNLFRGSKNAGEVAVVDQEMDVKFLQADNKSSQYVESRTFAVLEVARATGMPPHLLFELSRATFSNIDQQSLEFIIYHMGPHYARVAASATHHFAEPGHFFEFLPEALLKGDIKTRFEAYGIAIDKGVYSPNEVRSMENRNARKGGDEYRVGSGSTVEGAAPPAPRTPPPRREPPAPDGEPEED